MYCIYKITNKINDKVYIGQTLNFKKRKKDHISNANNCKIKTKLYNAMRKHGVNNFCFSIIETNITKEDINSKEKKYIENHNSYHKGYNSTLGGDSGFQSIEEIRGKISNTVKDHWKNGTYKNRKTNVQNALKEAHKNVSKRAIKMWQDENMKKQISKKISEKLSRSITAYNDLEEINFVSYNEAIEFLKNKGYIKASKSALTTAKQLNKKAYDYYWKV